MRLHCKCSWLSLQVNRCLSIKGAEDILNKPHAFEVSTTDDSMFFIADTDKVGTTYAALLLHFMVSHLHSLSCVRSKKEAVCAKDRTVARASRVCSRSYQLSMCCLCCDQEKEDWINAVGRAIVRHSKR